MSRPLVSVVIPTYNRALRVVRAVASALEQTYDRMQIVVVDDGSQDHTASTLQERFGGDDRVHVIRQDNSGAAAARNRGIAEANGDLLAFLDSDDEWEPWKISFQLACLEVFPDAGMIWTDMAAVDSDGAVVAERHIRRMYRAFDSLDLDDTFAASQDLEGLGSPERTGRLWFGDVYREMLRGNLVHTSTVLLTRDRLAEVGGFDEELRITGEDYDFHLRTCRAGPVAFADIPTITYRVGAPDQLNRPDLMVPLARNYLTTVEKALAHGDPRIDRSLARNARGSAHALVGEELLDRGLTTEARRHLWAAIIRRPSARVMALMTLSLLPPAVIPPLRKAYRAVSAPLRRLRGR